MGEGWLFVGEESQLIYLGQPTETGNDKAITAAQFTSKTPQYGLWFDNNLFVQLRTARHVGAVSRMLMVGVEL